MDTSSQDSSHEYVLMPWDDKTAIVVSEGNNGTQTYSRWELVQKQLCSSKILNVEDFISVIKSYNVRFEKNGQQMKPNWKGLVLHQYFAQLDDCERKNFFEENGVLSTIRNLTLQLKELVPRLEVLKRGFNSSIQLHQIQIASILGNAFFCTFPKGKTNCPVINFNTLYEGTYGSVLEYFIEKIKCLIHYFKRIHVKESSGNLSFHRLNIPDHKFPRWDKTTANLCSLKVDVEGKIEDQDGYLQMDFANKYVGGGVLGKGCVQEEIRFLICPELIATRLFTECLADNESLFVVGAERYCNYKGYSNTFVFDGDYVDNTPFDESGKKKTYIIILDALYFHHSSDQYRESKILRELKKAYVGFRPVGDFKILPLATGNWGCGAFGGDAQLKTLIQLMACSQARRDMLYLTFGNSALKNQIEEFYFTLRKKAVNIGTLYRIIRLYNRERKKNQTVFEFVIASVNKLEQFKLNRKFSMKSLPSTSKEVLSDCKIECTPFAKASEPKRKVEKQKPEEAISENFLEMDLDFDALDREIYINSKESSLRKCNLDDAYHLSSQQKFSVTQECESILDVMWYENELNSNKSSNQQREEDSNNSRKHLVQKESSTDPLFFNEEINMSVEDMRKNFSKTESTTSFSELSHYQRTRQNENETGRKKMVQPKITDCFFKK